MRQLLSATLMAILIIGPLDAPVAVAANPKAPNSKSSRPETSPPTTTPIKHLVVIFQENISFDHYFGTYPIRNQPCGRAAVHSRS